MNEQQATTTHPLEASDDSMVIAIRESIRQVYDPEIPVNIFELGLIYDIRVDREKDHAQIDMTLTTPNCPSAEHLPVEVQQRAEEVMGVGKVTVDVVWDPPWDQSRMSDEAQLALGLI